MADTRAFVQLGFASMRQWMEARLGQEMSAAYKAARNVRALEGVPESKVEKIGFRNVQVLNRLPEKTRKRDERLDKAAELSEKKLRVEVDAEIERKTHMPKERFRYWGEAVPEGVAQKLDEMITKIGWVLELDVTARSGRIAALEALDATILNTPDEQLQMEIEGT